MDRVRAATTDVDALVAVGSGTVNDLCKYAAFQDGKPYAEAEPVDELGCGGRGAGRRPCAFMAKHCRSSRLPMARQYSRLCF